MKYIKKGYPEEGELLLCTVRKVHHHSVFVELDEYKKQGMIHISEVSPGRIRNIRDYVVEGKKIVCKVLRVNEERGHIDLSLRRVNDNQRKNKVNELKKEQKAEKIVEFACANVKANLFDTLERIMPKVKDSYGTLHGFFQEVAENRAEVGILGLDPKLEEELLATIKQRIKPIEVEVKGKMKLVSFASDGISQVKEILRKVFSGKEKMKIIYEGSGSYQISVKANDYKAAEGALTKVVEEVTSHMNKKGGIAEFGRQDI